MVDVCLGLMVIALIVISILTWTQGARQLTKDSNDWLESED